MNEPLILTNPCSRTENVYSVLLVFETEVEHVTYTDPHTLIDITVPLLLFFSPAHLLLTKTYKHSRKMASSFTRLISGRNTAVLLASLGAGTMATGFLLSENSTLAAETKKKLYPPR